MILHVLSGLCKADLTCSHPKVRRKDLFGVHPFEPIMLIYTILLSLYLIKHKLLVPTFKVTDSFFLSSCHLSLPHLEVNSMMSAPTSHQIIKSTSPNHPPCYCLHIEGTAYSSLGLHQPHSSSLPVKLCFTEFLKPR